MTSPLPDAATAADQYERYHDYDIIDFNTSEFGEENNEPLTCPVDNTDPAAMDSEEMSFDEWRRYYQVDNEGNLRFFGKDI